MKKVLVIEDNLEVRENLAEILELSGYEVYTAENGKVGVQQARTSQPDIILCDVMMPELDGFGVLRILDQNPQTADIPFVFLTAKAEKDDFRKGMNLGADDYITKPFDDVELLDALEMRLKKSERIKKSFDGTPTGLNNFISEARGQQELNKLSENRELQRFRKKDIIYEEGQYAKRLYFIANGKVKTFKTNDVGKEYIIKIHKAGEFLGYQALIREDKYHESASALEETEVNLVPKEDFFALLYNNRDFSARFIKMLADNMEDQEEQLLSLAYNSIRKRVAESLLVLQERFAKEGISILRDDLASMVGTAKESVIRTLTDFKNEGLIKIEGGTISILNADKLAIMPN